MKNLFLVFAAVVILTGCHRKSSFYRSSYSPAYSWSNKESTDNKYTDDKNKFRTRMVLYDARLDLTVKNIDSVNVFLTRVATKYEGYVLTLGSSRSVIRVKSDRLSEALHEIGGKGKLKKKTISGDDVTDQFEDYNIRLENATKARERYLQLLAKAETVEAALKVEKELERLNGEIDLLEGKIKRIQHLVQFSTITVDMEEKIKPGIIGYVFVGLYKGVKWLFVRG